MAMDVPAAHFALPLPAGVDRGCGRGRRDVRAFGSDLLQRNNRQAHPQLQADPEAALPEAAADVAALLLDVVSVDFDPQAANVRVATATRTTADRIERRCTGHLRRICSPDDNPAASTTPTRGEPIPRMAQSMQRRALVTKMRLAVHMNRARASGT